MEKMGTRNPVSTIGFVLGLLAASTVFCQGGASKRVLFLGNSVWDFDGGVRQSFLGFCRAAGLDYEAISQMRRHKHTHGIEFLDYGRIPLNLPEIAADQEIRSIIREGHYDYVVVEGRRSGYLLPEWVERPDDRGQSIPYEENMAALREIHRTIVASGAQTVLYMHPGLSTEAEIKLPLSQVYGKLHADLERMEIKGRTHEVILVPANFLWLDAIRRYGVDDWFANRGHGNALARYASGCMLYVYITGNDPRENEYRELPKSWESPPEEAGLFATEEDALWIKRQVWLYYETRPN